MLLYRLHTLTIGDCIQSFLRGFKLPNGLQVMSFCHVFPQGWEGVTLPDHLHTLAFSLEFHQGLEGVQPSIRLQTLAFVEDLHWCLVGVMLLNRLLELALSRNLHRRLEVTLPSQMPCGRGKSTLTAIGARKLPHCMRPVMVIFSDIEPRLQSAWQVARPMREAAQATYHCSVLTCHFSLIGCG